MTQTAKDGGTPASPKSSEEAAHGGSASTQPPTAPPLQEKSRLKKVARRTAAVVGLVAAVQQFWGPVTNWLDTLRVSAPQVTTTIVQATVAASPPVSAAPSTATVLIPAPARKEPLSARPEPVTTPPSSLPSPPPAARSANTARIVAPVGFPRQVVDRCVQVEGRGQATEGTEFRVGVRGFNPGREWVRRKTVKVPNQNHDWRSETLYVGAAGDANMVFELVLYEVPADKLAKYDQAGPEVFFGAEELKADGVVEIHKVSVQRSAGPDTSCPVT